MKDLLDYIVRNLVSKPDAVVIEETSSAGNVELMLTVDPEDMGLIIGKGGQTIRALRKLLTVRAIAENVRVNLQLSEPAGGNTTAEKSDEVEEKSEDTETVQVEAETEEEGREKAESEEVDTEKTTEEADEEQPVEDTDQNSKSSEETAS
jgi:uncharacterized protein